MTFWYDLYTFENFILCEEIFYMKLRLLCGFYVSFIVFINVHFFFGNQPPVLQFITHPKNFPLCLTFQPSKHWNVVATYSKMTRRRTDVNRINKSLPYRATLPNVFFFVISKLCLYLYTFTANTWHQIKSYATRWQCSCNVTWLLWNQFIELKKLFSL